VYTLVHGREGYEGS